MQEQKIKLTYKGKKFELNLKVCGKWNFGLILRTRKTKPLLFDFKKMTNAQMSSLWVFFPFVIVWLDDKDKIIEARIIEPFTFTVRQEKKFKKLIEIPINSKNREIAEILVGKAKI